MRSIKSSIIIINKHIGVPFLVTRVPGYLLLLLHVTLHLLLLLTTLHYMYYYLFFTIEIIATGLMLMHQCLSLLWVKFYYIT